jgi:hypothetical protein
MAATSESNKELDKDKEAEKKLEHHELNSSRVTLSTKTHHALSVVTYSGLMVGMTVGYPVLLAVIDSNLNNMDPYTTGLILNMFGFLWRAVSCLKLFPGVLTNRDKALMISIGILLRVSGAFVYKYFYSKYTGEDPASFRNFISLAPLASCLRLASEFLVIPFFFLRLWDPKDLSTKIKELMNRFGILTYLWIIIMTAMSLSFFPNYIDENVIAFDVCLYLVEFIPLAFVFLFIFLEVKNKISRRSMGHLLCFFWLLHQMPNFTGISLASTLKIDGIVAVIPAMFYTFAFEGVEHAVKYCVEHSGTVEEVNAERYAILIKVFSSFTETLVSDKWLSTCGKA